MRMNRRSFIKRTLGSLLAFFGLSGGTYYYARYIEPDMLTIKEETIQNRKIADSFQGFKIVQFSDTHVGFHYNLEQLEKVVDQINGLGPDLILFTGDLVDKPNAYEWDDRIVEVLKKLQAPSGKFWIYGNHDHGGYGTDVVKKKMDRSGFRLLKNENTSIDKAGASFTLAGVDDIMLGKPDMAETLKGVNEQEFVMLMVHEPDYADHVASYPVDVQLSGHSHGGQIQIPFIGYLVTPPYAEKYVEGRHTVENLELYISRGLGTTRLPYRFLCKPEITVHTLSNSSA
ncbi:metallophosphoesterase [Thalassobacillus devorans]|uniref:metallophosphoesterase n=1 Tax=Thalassobacillus devorans TaxID=279813 RepID=UPI00048B57D7|nr:metallophosphoesterase [Thalassobacillus devorans]